MNIIIFYYFRAFYVIIKGNVYKNYYIQLLDNKNSARYNLFKHKGVMELKKFCSIKFKLLIFSFCLIVIPIIIIGSISYTKSSKVIENHAKYSNLSTVKNITSDVEKILNSINYTSLQLIQHDSLRNYLMMSKDDVDMNKQAYILKSEALLSYLIYTNEYIESATLQGFNGIEIDTTGKSRFINESNMTTALNLKGKSFWSINTYDDLNNKIHRVSLIRSINDINNIENTLGILKLDIDQKKLAKVYNESTVNENSEFYIFNDSDIVISSNDSDILFDEIPSELLKEDININKDGFYRVEWKNKEYLLAYSRIQPMNWTLISLVPIKEILDDLQIIQKVIRIGIIVSFIICIMIVIFFYKKFLTPLKQIRVLMKHIENENFVSIDVKGNDEIAMLFKSFNKMSNRLNQLMNQVYLVKIKQKESELKALQAQINPHFLYNTLDTIHWVARIESAFETSALIQALSKLFRLSLNNGSQFTSVKNEIEHLNNYIFLQKQKYETLVDFVIHVEDEVKECKVVKLIIQPLVENAIYHGISSLPQKGKINIVIKREKDNLIYEIIDNGVGINEKYINDLLISDTETSKGFGIKNVNDRIKLYFGDEYGLSFKSMINVGTTAIVKQPYIKEGEEYDKNDDCRR
ncbi:histidine kinase [Vallitalea longa]|uniref:Histidine kinase n=1 Tax=Vallitalea longa TaxID=2936439 RepID=A0A9W5YH96_9FIRM|nr:histidine kinase [Vallitalea longa]